MTKDMPGGGAFRTQYTNRPLDIQACHSCGRAIVWEVTFKGARVPLDHPPEKRYVRNDEGKMVIVDTWLSHFATCPQAQDWRKKS
ncbi:MAG TPA: hypothetical protein VNA25_02095 [Phycisphaerae bacterium]|nr:hypothetical protein [Phycisphaerae bacterium]